MTCGVPQGSILGPLFFLVYINDLSSAIERSQLKLFADDATIYYSSKNVIALQNVIQQDLLNVAQWCDSNALTINMKKTKLMLFGTRASIKKHKLMPVLLNQTPIEFTNNYKYLGVIFDSSLSFSKFVTNIIKTTTHKAYVLSKIRCYLNTQTCLSIYKSMAMPFFPCAFFSGAIFPGYRMCHALTAWQRIQGNASDWDPIHF